MNPLVHALQLKPFLSSQPSHLPAACNAGMASSRTGRFEDIINLSTSILNGALSLSWFGVPPTFPSSPSCSTGSSHSSRSAVFESEPFLSPCSPSTPISMVREWGAVLTRGGGEAPLGLNAIPMGFHRTLFQWQAVQYMRVWNGTDESVAHFCINNPSPAEPKPPPSPHLAPQLPQEPGQPGTTSMRALPCSPVSSSSRSRSSSLPTASSSPLMPPHSPAQPWRPLRWRWGWPTSPLPSGKRWVEGWRRRATTPGEFAPLVVDPPIA
jgi:hypothetical protein